MVKLNEFVTVEYWASHMKWIETTDTTAVVVLVALSLATFLLFLCLGIIWCEICRLIACTRRVRVLKKDLKSLVPRRRRRKKKNDGGGNVEVINMTEVTSSYVLVDKDSDERIHIGLLDDA